MDAQKLLAACKVVPVLTLDSSQPVVEIAKIFNRCGFNAIEITLRTETALDVIRTIATEVPELIVGAGSIRSTQLLDEAKDHGAKFAVSPGYTEQILARATELNMPLVPGAATASEMMVLAERGYTLQKFFPAEQLGGLALINSISKPLPNIRFFPTGGIDLEKAKQYLACPAVACVGGSWMISEPLTKSNLVEFSKVVEQSSKSLGLCFDA